MNRFCYLLALGLFVLAPVRAQDSVVAPSDNLVVDGVPKIPASLAETAGGAGVHQSDGVGAWGTIGPQGLVGAVIRRAQHTHLARHARGAAREDAVFLRIV